MKIYYSYNSVPELAALSPMQIQKLSVESYRIQLKKWQFWAVVISCCGVFLLSRYIFCGDASRLAGIIICLIMIQFISLNMRISIMKELLKNSEKQ